jgi:hypothetical protein
VLAMMNSPETKFNAVLRPAWQYLGDYSFYAYAKPEIALRTLENLLGRSTMARVMRTYHERWRFRHPSSDDFFDAASEVSGRDLTSFFDQTIRHAGVLDYEVASASTRGASPARGVVERDGKRVTSDAARSTAADAGYESTVVVRRRGEVMLPVDVAFKFKGRPPERVRWDGRERWVRYVFTRAEPLEWAEVDPDRKLELDVDTLNNSRTVAADERVPAKWTSALMFFVQNLLAFCGA